MIRHLGDAAFRGLLVRALGVLALGFAACASSASEPKGPMVGQPVSGASVAPSPSESPKGSEPVRVATASPRPGITPAGATSVGTGAAQASAYSGPQPCTVAVRGDSPVARACREGGQKAAKNTMKNLITQARAGGASFRCDDCHLNTDNYAQLGTGVDEKFRRLLAAAGVK
jgi:hypothetical protein